MKLSYLDFSSAAAYWRSRIALKDKAMAVNETELCYLSRAKEYFLVSLSLTRQALSRHFLAAIRRSVRFCFFPPP